MADWTFRGFELPSYFLVGVTGLTSGRGKRGGGGGKGGEVWVGTVSNFILFYFVWVSCAESDDLMLKSGGVCERRDSRC